MREMTGRMRILALVVAIVLVGCDDGPTAPADVAGTWVALEGGQVGEQWCGNPIFLTGSHMDLTDEDTDAGWRVVNVTIRYDYVQCSGEPGWMESYPTGEYRQTREGVTFQWLGWDNGPPVATWVSDNQLRMEVEVSFNPIELVYIRE